MSAADDDAVTGPARGDAPARDAATPDPLDALRTELEEDLDRLPVAERVPRFEHANELLARELAALDEV